MAGVGWLIGGVTTALLFAFCSLLAATGVYRYGDRALLGMLGARPFALAEDPLLRSIADPAAPRREHLEAAIPHELAHVRRRDVRVQTFVVLFAVTLVELSQIGGWFSRALLFVLGPIAAAFVHLLLSSRRELQADALAAAAGDANDLADALLRLDRAAELVE